MALTKDDILEAISNMTVIELKELLDAFEEKFDVTAAAPVAVAAAAPAGGGGDAAAEEEKDEFDVVLTAAGAAEDPGREGRQGPPRRGPEGGQGPRRRRPEADPREGHQGRRRGRQGQARRGRRHRRAQVSRGADVPPTRPRRRAVPGPPAVPRPGLAAMSQLRSGGFAHRWAVRCGRCGPGA